MWFHLSGTQFAFADFIKPILEAKSAKFKATFERDGKQVGTADIMVSGPVGSEWSYSDRASQWR